MANQVMSMPTESMSDHYLYLMVELLRKIIELIEAMDLTVNIDIREIRSKLADLDKRSGFTMRTNVKEAVLYGSNNNQWSGVSSPDIGGNLIVATNVSDGKNAKGEFIGQRVGRDQHKFEGLQWKFLDAATWSAMLQEFDKFVVTARIPDMVHNRMMTIRMYQVTGRPHQ